MPMERAARCLVSNGICFRRTEARPISCARGLPIGIMESGTAAHQCSPFSTTPVQEECEVGDYLSEVCLSLSRSSSFSLSSRSASLNSSSASAHQDIALEDWVKPMAMNTLDRIINRFTLALKRRPCLLESETVFRCIASELKFSIPDALCLLAQTRSPVKALELCLLQWRGTSGHKDPATLEEELYRSIKSTQSEALLLAYTDLRQSVIEAPVLALPCHIVE
ncbi:uncharacterized protein LOC135823390 [Sycon ciliatum]|uniref:uncharacterized protein LOC135823390 n=1 Tax=Sycon ciliatum TaxID=27933 RepID=UPI0031F6CC90